MLCCVRSAGSGGVGPHLITLAASAEEAELASVIGCKDARCRVRGGASSDESAQTLRLRGGVGVGV